MPVMDEPPPEKELYLEEEPPLKEYLHSSTSTRAITPSLTTSHSATGSHQPPGAAPGAAGQQPSPDISSVGSLPLDQFLSIVHAQVRAEMQANQPPVPSCPCPTKHSQYRSSSPCVDYLPATCCQRELYDCPASHHRFAHYHRLVNYQVCNACRNGYMVCGGIWVARLSVISEVQCYLSRLLRASGLAWLIELVFNPRHAKNKINNYIPSRKRERI